MWWAPRIQNPHHPPDQHNVRIIGSLNNQRRVVHRHRAVAVEQFTSSNYTPYCDRGYIYISTRLARLFE